jgi:uncharacterized protein (DUF1778 family)
MAVRVKGVLTDSCHWQYNRGMAKKPQAERTFDQPLQVRVTPDQLALFKQAAQADGRTLSNWARERLERAAKKEMEKR